MKHRHFLLHTIVLLLMVLPFWHCSKEDSGIIKAPGIVDGDVITLKAVVPGTIRSMDLKEGETVTKDKLVMRIDSEKVTNQINELAISERDIGIKKEKLSSKLHFIKANIKYLHKQVQRFGRLTKKKAVPGEKLEALEMKLLEAKTSADQIQKSRRELEISQEKIANKKAYLQLLLDDHEINSPVNGVVLETFVTSGETVFPGTAVADILDVSSLFIEIFVEEKEMAALKLKQTVKINVDRVDAEKGLTGVISYFGKKAEFSPKYIVSEQERKSLLYQVKVRVDDPDGRLKIGMPVTVVLHGATASPAS